MFIFYLHIPCDNHFQLIGHLVTLTLDLWSSNIIYKSILFILLLLFFYCWPKNREVLCSFVTLETLTKGNKLMLGQHLISDKKEKKEREEGGMEGGRERKNVYILLKENILLRWSFNNCFISFFLCLFVFFLIFFYCFTNTVTRSSQVSVNFSV